MVIRGECHMATFALHASLSIRNVKENIHVYNLENHITLNPLVCSEYLLPLKPTKLQPTMNVDFSIP